ncbi:nuclear transport factor 2 family protein [Leptospira sarikeiensis]|uniref:Nuclear transport factor 2 family protein n=1 Tax=Leptospira sarikeiensis TaxID=2484943 RepID=A0A4R9KCF0_9LEPT|nr:nuclear transport factor 2 family protein [Leptospira sarikeiensis]TGL62782.1 nuclear transport factor 2 family protein [Leptospira sarikeiensis]
MHPNETKIRDFYKNFGSRNSANLSEFYSEEVEFSDPVFPNLKGGAVSGMWAMLSERMDPNASIELVEASADTETGKAYWVAKYLFSKTGRQVQNHIRTEFSFKNGKVVKQKDRFPFWKWTRMALGMPGILLGWTPLVQGKVRSEAARNLEHYLRKKGISA